MGWCHSVTPDAPSGGRKSCGLPPAERQFGEAREAPVWRGTTAQHCAKSALNPRACFTRSGASLHAAPSHLEQRRENNHLDVTPPGPEAARACGPPVRTRTAHQTRGALVVKAWLRNGNVEGSESLRHGEAPRTVRKYSTPAAPYPSIDVFNHVIREWWRMLDVSYPFTSSWASLRLAQYTPVTLTAEVHHELHDRI
jgi:hypothetical protein